MGGFSWTNSPGNSMNLDAVDSSTGYNGWGEYVGTQSGGTSALNQNGAAGSSGSYGGDFYGANIS